MNRKLQIILLMFVILSLHLKAQCPLNTAIDFTATDSHGQEIKLFDILDKGQYVLIDFFNTNCDACEYSTPHIKEAYERLGCNKHEVFFMEITPYDSNTACNNWASHYGVEYPTIGKDGGGSTIFDQYKAGAFPTIILIAPDRNIVIKDLWPVDNSNNVVNALAPFGIEEHECGESANIENEVAGFKIYPNPVSEVINIEGDVTNVVLYNSFGQAVKADVNNGQIDVTSLQNGIYYMTVTGSDKSRKVEKIIVAK